MMQFKEHKDIDKKKWDDCVIHSPDTILFAHSWYLDIICPGWGALVLDDYKAVLPLPVKHKFGIAYLHQPFFSRYFGLFSKQGSDKLMLHQFLKEIPLSVKYIEYCLHEQNELNSDQGFKTSEKRFQLLEMNKMYEHLQKGYNENTRRNIKKAYKAGYKITHGIKPESVVELFIKTKGKELEVFSKKNYEMLHHLVQECVLRKKGMSMGVSDDKGNLVAAGFFMGAKERFIFLKSGVTPGGRKNGAMHFMFDYFIRSHAEENSVLDFGGSSVESVARFYKSFGAKDVVYLQIKKNNLPFPLKLLKH